MVTLSSPLRTEYVHVVVVSKGRVLVRAPLAQEASTGEAHFGSCHSAFIRPGPCPRNTVHPPDVTALGNDDRSQAPPLAARDRGPAGGDQGRPSPPPPP